VYVFCGGAAVQWLRDGAKIMIKAQLREIETSLSVTLMWCGIYFVPALAGFRSLPHWDQYGNLSGNHWKTTNAHIENCLEGVL
jgi:glycerol kinase